MANFYVGEVLFETGGTIDTPGDINVTAICDCAGSTGTAGQILSSTGTALLWATGASAGIPCSILTGKGEIVVATGASTPTALPVGTNGQVLYANSACSTGLCWGAAGGGIPCSVITAKGDIVVGTASSTPAVLPVGTFNQVLLADSGCAAGLKWGGLPQASVAGLGVMYGCVTDTAPNNTSVGYFTLPYSSVTCTIAIGNNSMIGATGDSHIAIGVGIANPTGATGCNVFIGNRIGSGNAQNAASNVIVGQFAACSGLDGSSRNVILGANAATALSSAFNNVVIGYGVAPPTSSSDCTLAIGYDTGCHWLTGNSTKAIRPGAGIIDCAGSCGTAGQVLMSNGSNAICWGTVSGGSGTVTSITAGSGLTGGTITSSGTIALDTTCVIQPTIVTTKGDLITATAASTPTALPAGADGQVLTACSTCSSGLVWATSAAGVWNTITTTANTTSGGNFNLINFGGAPIALSGILTVVLNGGSTPAVFQFVLSGEPTNYQTPWNPYFAWPTPPSYDPGTFQFVVPVYPDPLQNTFLLEYTPAETRSGVMFQLTYTSMYGIATPVFMV